MIHVVALPSRLNHVCARYRLAAFQPILQEHGVSLELGTWPRWWVPGSSFFARLRRADVVVVQRRLLSPWQMKLVRNASRRLVYDFDDAMFLHDSYDPRGLDSPKRRRRFVRMIQNADAVLAGNSFLLDEAATWTSPSKIWLAPTCVDSDRYPLAHHDSSNSVQMAWIGSPSTLRGLERITSLLEACGIACPELNFKVICDRSLSLTRLPVQFCHWSEETEAAELARADIGMSWLPADDWSRGKCGLKVLQYQAAGLPVVANRVGVQPKLVRDGETGFLADSPDEWLAAIRRLAADPSLRRRLGAAGRARVERDYHVRRGAALWLELLKTLCHHRVAASPPR